MSDPASKFLIDRVLIEVATCTRALELLRRLSRVERRELGRRVRADLVTEFGGDPSEAYRLAMNVVPMGAHNGVDIAQETHLAVLRSAGLCDDSVLIV